MTEIKLNAVGSLLQLNQEINTALETIDKMAQQKNATSELYILFKWKKGLRDTKVGM